MKYLLGCVFVIALFITVVWTATPVAQCPDNNFDDLAQRIDVIPCGNKKCKLRKGTNITVHFRFKPEHKVHHLTNEVFAKIAELPLPFIGVDGTSACPHVTRASDGQPSPCPLEPHQEYTYTNVFPVLDFYPSVRLRVHWALNDGKRNVICFEVPAQIGS